MNGKIKTIIAISSIIILLVAIALLKSYQEKRNFIEPNDAFAVGNTTGNLNNKGFYAEENGLVYFSNPYDGGSLYIMNSDQSNIKKLASGNISLINVINGYAYYFSSTSGDQAGLGYIRNGKGLYRTDSNGSSVFAMAKCTTDNMIVVGNNVFFMDYGEGTNDTAHVTLQKVSINNENQELVLDMPITLGGASNGRLYFGGVTADHHLYSLEPETNSISPVSDINVHLPIVNGGYVYYLDLDNDYHLTSMYLMDGSKTDLSGERVDTYNLYGGIIYYQSCVPNAYALKRMNLDGSNKEIVQTGVYHNINITSTYTYFQDFNNNLPVYFTSTSGNILVQEFDAAKTAAFTENK